MDPLKMYFLLNIRIFHCYVCFREGNFKRKRSHLKVRYIVHGFLVVTDVAGAKIEKCHIQLTPQLQGGP